MDEAPEVPDLRSMNLPTKPERPIKYTFRSLSPLNEPPSKAIHIVFVNGLGLPQSSRQSTLQLLQADFAREPSFLLPSPLPSPDGGDSSHAVAVTAATYDRYGQGFSQPLPDGAKPRTHDMLDAVETPEVDRRVRQHRDGKSMSLVSCSSLVFFISGGRDASIYTR